MMRIEDLPYRGKCSGWAVLNTHPHREHIALTHLRRQGFFAYCPMIRRRHSHARRVTNVLRPMFPRYVFVHLASCVDRWRALASTVGIRSVVRCGAELSLLDDAFVQGLKARELDGAVSRPECDYQVGQHVRLAGGPFDSIVATIVDMHEHDRLTVLMDLLNRPVKVRVGEAQVMAV